MLTKKKITQLLFGQTIAEPLRRLVLVCIISEVVVSVAKITPSTGPSLCLPSIQVPLEFTFMARSGSWIHGKEKLSTCRCLLLMALS
jgi:hypothetical protein